MCEIRQQHEIAQKRMDALLVGAFVSGTEINGDGELNALVLKDGEKEMRVEIRYYSDPVHLQVTP